MSKDSLHLKSLEKALLKFPSLMPHFEALAQVAVPRIGIQLRRLEDLEADLPIGASKVGGFPDTPPDFEWKYHKGQPLAFLAQFRLDELVAFDTEHVLPKSGLLSLFCDYSGTVWGSGAEDATAWHVEIFPFENLQQALPPADEDGEIYRDFTDCAVSFQVEFDLPDAADIPVEFEDEEAEEYVRLQYAGSKSHLLGMGHLIHGERGLPDRLTSLMFASTKPEPVMKLIKFYSEWQAGMNWGDSDWIQFFIPVCDLGIGNMKRVWAKVEM